MQTELIPAKVFCASHAIEQSFIQTLYESGLIDITFIEEDPFVPAAQLEQLERIVRMYFEMDINVEGIETIIHLLHSMHSMQQEMNVLKNRLRLYEESGF